MKTTIPLLLTGAISLLPVASAVNILRSTSLSTCMDNSGFSATLFNVSFTPGDGQLKIQINGESTVSGNVQAKVTVLAYGFPVFTETLDPCNTSGLSAMCPMSAQVLDLNFQQTIPQSTVSQIPVIAYKIPDLDGVARMEVIDSTNTTVACVEAPLSNGQTVAQPAVGWVTAVISGLALLTSAALSGMGHAMTSAHIAANALTLFAYFQAMAMFGMMAVELPPLALAWSQNFDWAVGILRVGFMQDIFHWYIQATGGTPANLFQQQQTVSVQIAKRSLGGGAGGDYAQTRAALYGFQQLTKRSNNDAIIDPQSLVKVTGIARMSYKAHIESTNFFLTGMSFFVVALSAVLIFVSIFRAICNLKFIKTSNRFPEFRAKWLVVTKGILYRVIFIGFAPMMVLCPWEWTHLDSPATIVLSVFFLISLLTTLSWAVYKILTLPRAALYADPEQLNRWGYLYVSFRPERFWYIVPYLLYILAKAFTLAFAQSAGVAQAIIMLILELANFAAQAWLKPWLDRRTNIVNIAITVVAVINSVFLLVFSGVTNAPSMVSGIMGVIFFIVNAVFALTLLILLLVALGFALCSRNPEGRYKPAYDEEEREKRGGGGGEVRDLDADLPPPPSTQRQEGGFEGAGRDGIPNTSLHDHGSRSLNSRDESERAVAMERAMGSSRPLWPPQQQQGVGAGAGGGSMRSTTSSRPSFIGDGQGGAAAGRNGSLSGRSYYSPSIVSSANTTTTTTPSMRSLPSMRSRPSVGSYRGAGRPGAGAAGGAGMVGGMGEGTQGMRWDVAGAGYEGVAR